MGFYSVGKRGTVTTHRFNARGACKRLYEGMKGVGTNEDALIEVIAGHTVAQRQEIKTKYKIMYGKDLIKELDSELSGEFSQIVLSLMKDPEEYIIECIRNAIVKSRGDKLLKKMKKMASKKALCSDAYTLLGILVLRSNKELNAIKEAYKGKYDRELEEHVGQDFADEFRSLIFAIIIAARDESQQVDMDLLQGDVESLKNGGDGLSKEEHFQTCFEERSWNHLAALFKAYKEDTGEGIEGMLDKSETFSDILKEAFKAVVKIILSKADFYAERLKDAIDGLGTDDTTLISVIVLRSEIDLVDIIERYEVLFGKSLEDDVVGDTSGDYKNILLKLLTVPEYDEEVAEEKFYAKVIPGVEISTQTEEAEEPHQSVNAADEDGHEAVGHEVEEETVEVQEVMEEQVRTELETEMVETNELVVEEEQNRVEEGSTEKAEEEVQEGDNPDTEEIPVETAQETREEEQQQNGASEEEENAVENESVVKEEAVDEQTTTLVPAQDEEKEEKKGDEVDNAEGG